MLVEEDMDMKHASPMDRVKKVVGEVGRQLGKCINSDGNEKPFILAILPEKSPDLYSTCSTF